MRSSDWSADVCSSDLNAVSLVLACLAAALGLLFLGWILWTLVAKGIGGIDLALFTQDTPPPMSAGGLRNAFFGSAVMCLMAIGIGTPLGIAAGTWLAEYGAARRSGTVVGFGNAILLSAPSVRAEESRVREVGVEHVE